MAPNDIASKEQYKKYSRVFAESDGDDIVISGMSGKFPNSQNVDEFEYNLYNKIDMVDDKETRWRHFSPEIPRRGGKISNLDKFDATFFGVHFKQAHTMDPQCRILLEVSYEAILDAGVNPKTLRGTRTGVYVGGCISEAEKTWFYEKSSSGGFGITGCSRAMLANRISYVLGLNGPSYVVDTACSSSIYALDNAFSALRNGEIDAAIVGGSNLTLHPYVTMQFARLGVLASDGFCRPFDQDATGYTRSESINCIFLQRRRDAMRIYASIVYSKTNCDGYKTEGITYPSGVVQEALLREFYEDIGISVEKIGYLEAHSTGTVVGDPEECRAVDNVICQNRKKPLLTGSVKSNIGHAEASSGICSIVKAILAIQSGTIAPNINFKSPRKEIPALMEGRLLVVHEPTPLPAPYVAVNSFGFGGANAHVLLRGDSKEKIKSAASKDSLPKLIFWSSRTEDGVNVLLNSLESRPLDAEYIALLHNIQYDAIPGFVFRGYGLFAQAEDDKTQSLAKEVQHYTGVKRPIVWVFSGMGSQWAEMGTSLMAIPIFRESIHRCHNVLKTKGLDLLNILTSTDTSTFDNILHSFVGIAAIQIGLVDVLRELEFEPDYMIGHSVGELGCAYADGGFTAEQMILSAYSRGKVSLEIEKIKGSMAAIGLGYKNIIKLLPQTIEVACHNSNDSSTISGPSDEVAKFVAQLKSKNIFAKEVPCSNIAYHSRYIAHMGPLLLKYLREIVPNPKKRSSKWLSTSVPKQRWNQPESQFCSAEYHTNNLLSSVLFEEASAYLPPNSLTVEIAPHGLLQAILKKSMPNAINIALTHRGNKNNVQFFLAALGKIYNNGANLPIDRLYPKVEFPVSRGTNSVSSYIRWDHSDDYYVPRFDNIKTNASGEKIFQVGLTGDDEEFLSGHIIDGRILAPATYYLQLVWETFSNMVKGPLYIDVPVEFSDIRFLRATPLAKDKRINLTVMIHYGTGNFEITEDKALVVTGNIRQIENPQLPQPIHVPDSTTPVLENRDFYKELRLRGYHYAGSFRSVEKARSDGLTGTVKWSFNWVSFIDCLLQIQIIGADSRSLMLPTRIRTLRICGMEHMGILSKIDPENQKLDVQVDRNACRIVSGGIEIIGLHASSVSRRKPPGVPVLESYQFVSNCPAPKVSLNDAARICVQLATENNSMAKLKIVEVNQDQTAPVITYFQAAVDDLPVLTGDYMLLSSQEVDIPGVHVENGKLSTQTNCTFVISTNLLSRQPWIMEAQKSIGDTGYLVSVESFPYTCDQLEAPAGFNILTYLPTDEDRYLILMRRAQKEINVPTVIRISENDVEYKWLEAAQAIKGPLILFAQNENLNGLIGLVNCLRREPDTNQTICVFIDDSRAPPFDMENSFYAEQLKLGFAINVFRNGRWGTYRHLKLKPSFSQEKNKHIACVNMLQRGDLSSFAWLDGYGMQKNAAMKVYYSSLNFRDIMVSTGRITLEHMATNRLDNPNIMGFEYSGIGSDGIRYMGVSARGCIATHMRTDPVFKMAIPDHWTLEEAATVPCIYFTVVFAFFKVTDIRKGNSILIHSGTGGVGQAAIHIALHCNLEVFTTVSTKEKKQYLLKKFPKLKESHIGNSRDTSFEYMISEHTNGKGVDFVLNSLAEEKLIASVRCLGPKGHFFEIGKFDIANDNKLGLGPFDKELSFHSMYVDQLFNKYDPVLDELVVLINEGIKSGMIVPLPTTVFEANEVEKAFRYMASGKHMGKVLIKIHDEKTSLITAPINSVPQLYFEPDYTFIIPGGLGGFGLELADWIILRGARKIVLSSSRGISKQYQSHKIRLWTSYGATIVVRTDDITTYEGCKSLISASMKLGPISGIFNLAVQLRDAIFVNQDATKFKECIAPKALATKYLDELSRKMCPHLKYFVVFSSVSCGRGNAGQTNYGMANSIMERIVEQRVAAGLPAKAIQWGAVGEVGLVADMAENKIDMEIGGTLQQRISSCLQELNSLMMTPDPIVSSMVVAEKRTTSGANIMEAVMNIIGIRDLKSISMGSSLSETGMDSLMAMEIKQTLERDFELFLTPQDLRSLTFQKLQEISDSRTKDAGEKVKLRLAQDDKPLGMNLLIRSLGDELNSGKTVLPVVTKNSNIGGLNPSLMISGVQGVAGETWYNLALGLHSPAYVLQLTDTIHMQSIEEITAAVFENASQIFQRKQPFYLIAHSFGALIALEMAHLLEQAGYTGYITLIDGAPLFLKRLAAANFNEENYEEEMQIALFTTIVQHILPEEINDNVTMEFLRLPGLDKKMKRFLEYAENQTVYSKDYANRMMLATYNRIKIVMNMNMDQVKPIKSSITLIRPTDVSVTDLNQDYDLSKLTTGKVTVKFIEGDHTSMLDNPKLAQLVNSYDPNIELEPTEVVLDYC